MKEVLIYCSKGDLGGTESWCDRAEAKPGPAPAAERLLAEGTGAEPRGAWDRGTRTCLDVSEHQTHKPGQEVIPSLGFQIPVGHPSSFLMPLVCQVLRASLRSQGQRQPLGRGRLSPWGMPRGWHWGAI